MKILVFSLFLALLCGVALATAPQKAIVVTYEDPSTPQSVVDDAMNVIKAAGGVITHEYSELKQRKRRSDYWANSMVDLFKGFAAKASDKAVEAVNALGGKYLPTIEQDIVYTTQDE